MPDNLRTIRALNDELRCYLLGGGAVISAKVAALGASALTRLVERLADFNDFSPRLDPKGEHALGLLNFEDMWIAFQIDYYDTALDGPSHDPGDPNRTERVMKIMLAEELITS